MHAPVVTSLPYGLEPLVFPFPALATLAGRLPHGGGREVALAALTCARLASAAISPLQLGNAERVARANAAKVWLASVALPSSTRSPLQRCIESTTGTPTSMVTPMRALIAATTPHLDGPSIGELERLMRQLAAA